MEKIQVHFILEILGRPPSNIVTALNGLIEKIGQEKGVRILEKIVHEPVHVKDSKDLYTTFAELTLEFDSFENYFGALFAYMPSNTEIIKPEKIEMRNDYLNFLANRLLLRLHDYDAITKNMIMERDVAIQKLREVAPHLFKQPQNNQPVNEQRLKKVEKKKSKSRKSKNKK